MPQTAKSIGKRLQAMHKALKTTQREVSRITGISEHRYSQYVTGSRPLTLAAAHKICDHYGVTLDYLLRGNTGTLPADMQREVLRAESALLASEAA